MSQTKPRTQGPFAKHKLAIETVVLTAILVMPIFLYLAAEARLDVVVSILLGLVSVLMLAVIRLS
jgi:hypothetical protein